jgi:hypothetical protein
VLDAATAAFLEGGCALIVGTVGPGGAPRASRAWGLTVLPGGGTTLRVLVSTDDPVPAAGVRDGGRIAITAADVPTLRSMQLKGRVTGIEEATDEDRSRAARYMEAFFADVNATDGTPVEVIERVTPFDVRAWSVEVEELFDQTPGPGAGAPLRAGS